MVIISGRGETSRRVFRALRAVRRNRSDDKVGEERLCCRIRHSYYILHSENEWKVVLCGCPFTPPITWHLLVFPSAQRCPDLGRFLCLHRFTSRNFAPCGSQDMTSSVTRIKCLRQGCSVSMVTPKRTAQHVGNSATIPISLHQCPWSALEPF